MYLYSAIIDPKHPGRIPHRHSIRRSSEKKIDKTPLFVVSYLIVGDCDQSAVSYRQNA